MFNYDYEEPYAERECFECTEKENALASIKDWLEGLIQQLYGQEPFSARMVENCLDEIAHSVGLKLPESDLQIVAKQKRPAPLTDQILDKWKSLNNQYLKSLTH